MMQNYIVIIYKKDNFSSKGKLHEVFTLSKKLFHLKFNNFFSQKN